MPVPADPQDDEAVHDVPDPWPGHGPRAGAQARSHALAALRQAILTGGYAPGQRLVEEELAAIFDVTRASMRAALLDLTTEGLVERIPNRGARVRVVSIEEAVAITECRMVLESLCAVKAALVITDAQAADLRRLGDVMTEAADAGDVDKYSELNHQLHRRVCDISGQHTAVSLLERLNAQLVRHQYRIAQRPGRPRHSLGEHLAIINAVAGRRPADAEAATRRHLEGVIEAIRADVPPPGGLADGSDG
jgi:DNA-binding GntR family transcriptional regulator